MIILGLLNWTWWHYNLPPSDRLGKLSRRSDDFVKYTTDKLASKLVVDIADLGLSWCKVYARLGKVQWKVIFSCMTFIKIKCIYIFDEIYANEILVLLLSFTFGHPASVRCAKRAFAARGDRSLRGRAEWWSIHSEGKIFDNGAAGQCCWRPKVAKYKVPVRSPRGSRGLALPTARPGVKGQTDANRHLSCPWITFTFHLHATSSCERIGRLLGCLWLQPSMRCYLQLGLHTAKSNCCVNCVLRKLIEDLSDPCPP